MKEDALQRLVDVWASGEAGAALGFATARLFDAFDPIEREKERILAERGITGVRAQMKLFKELEKGALEYLALSRQPEGERDAARFAELAGDTLVQFLITDSLANVFCPACKLWNTGYGAIDLALHDIAGKVYGVPAWRLLGDKNRERIRVYCDTPGSNDPKVYAEKVLRRKNMGFTVIKMDLYTRLVANKPGAVDMSGAATDDGLKYLCEYIQAARELVGHGFPLAADHFGKLTVKDCIRYARAFEPHNLAWAEDFLPNPDVAGVTTTWKDYKELKEATTTPILAGEQFFGLQEGFKDMIDNRALDIIHPDYVASGARTFCAEVILTTREDLVESEFGSSIHESRILEQRKGLDTGGRIASNASFLIEYMFMLSLSPTVDISELPVKMWGRYLPDVYSIAVLELFGLSLGRDQIDFLFPAEHVELPSRPRPSLPTTRAL